MRMGVADKEVRIRDSYTLRKRGSTFYIAVNAEYFRNLGVDPEQNPEGIPDELTTEFVVQGRDEGTLEIDLKTQVEEVTDGA